MPAMTRRLMARLDEEELPSATASKEACPALVVSGGVSGRRTPSRSHRNTPGTLEILSSPSNGSATCRPPTCCT